MIDSSPRQALVPATPDRAAGAARPVPSRRAMVVLAVLCVLLTAVSQVWVRRNLAHIPPSWDDGFYMYLGLSEYELAARGDLAGLARFVVTRASWAAPLVPLSTVPFYIVFGAEPASAYLVNGLYLFLLLAAVYALALPRGGRRAACLAAAICCGFPAVVVYPREYLFELPLAAAVAVAYLFVDRSQGFRTRRDSAIAGAAAGVAMLIKTMGAAFFLPPAALALAAIVRPGTPSRRRNAALFFAVAALVAAAYYLPNLRAIAGYLVHFGVGTGAAAYTRGAGALLSLHNWTTYGWDIALRGVSVPFVALAVATATAWIVTRRRGAAGGGSRLLWAWFVCGYVVLSLTPNKGGERYALPLLAPLAVTVAVTIALLPPRWLRRALAGAAVAVAALNAAYQTKSERGWYATPSTVLSPVHHAYYFQRDYGWDPARDWDPMVILERIESEAAPAPGPVRVLVAVDHAFLNYGIIELYATLGRLRGELGGGMAVRSVSYGAFTGEQLREEVAASDFVIGKSGALGPEFSNRANVVVQRDLAAEPIATFAMGDGASALLYRGGAAALKPPPV